MLGNGLHLPGVTREVGSDENNVSFTEQVPVVEVVPLTSGPGEGRSLPRVL